jgi:hypothetical protein
MAKVTQAQIIRNHFQDHPTDKVADVAKAFGLKYQNVYMVKRGMDKKLSELAYEIGKGRNRKADWKTLHISSSDNSIEKVMERETLKLPEVGDTVGGLVFTKLKNGKFRWLPPAMVPMPEPKQIEMFEPEADPVNHPAHYKVGGIETIDFIEAKRLNYNMGNAVKYITRADHKGNRKQDLEKAIWYLKRELDHSI